MNYTSYQIADALQNQGLPEDKAREIAWALGDQRFDEGQTKEIYNQLGLRNGRLPRGNEGEQGSSLIPNLAEGVGYTSGALVSQGLGKLFKGGKPRLPMALPMLGGALGNLLTLDSTNFYDRASAPQFLADMGGNMIGGTIGNAIGSGVGRALGAAGGRLAGAGVGSLLGPLGTAAGSFLGGWLLPKLLPAGSKSVEKDDGESGGGWGTLAAGGAGLAALSPGGRRMIGAMIPEKLKPFTNPLSRTTGRVVGVLGGKPLKAASKVYEEARPKIPEDAGIFGKAWGGVKAPWQENDAMGKGLEEYVAKLFGGKYDT